jgi:hypothetical protein
MGAVTLVHSIYGPLFLPNPGLELWQIVIFGPVGAITGALGVWSGGGYLRSLKLRELGLNARPRLYLWIFCGNFPFLVLAAIFMGQYSQS